MFSLRRIYCCILAVVLLCGTTILSSEFVLAIPTATIIVRFSDVGKFFTRQAADDVLWRGASPVFAELHRNDKTPSLLSAPSPALSVLRRYVEVPVPTGSDPMVFLRKIRAADGVEYADFAKISQIEEQTTDDSLSGTQWALRRIGADKAWKVSTGAGIVVGVLDTGVDFFHPDLARQLAVNSAEDANHNGTFEPWPAAELRKGVSGDLDGRDDDGNGFIDDVIGYDFVDQSIVNAGDYLGRDAIPIDEHGHGTSVAGIIAATANNKIGIAGIAPGAKIKVLRCHDITGNAEEDDIAAAIIYAAMNGVRVLNMSFGDVMNTPLTRDALAFATERGCILVASAGNDGSELRRFPASYPGVISVAATTELDRRATFSSFGSQLTISAPGVGIWTTARGNSYRSFQGTSAAAPHVAAAAALLLAVQPDLSPAEVRGILQATAQDLGTKGWDTQFGAGLLNCETAVNAVGRTVVQIEDPLNDAVWASGDILPVRGAVLTPLLNSWTLEIAAGENPSGAWQAISSGTVSQNRSSALGEIHTASLSDTTYTLRLKAQLKTGNTLEHRVRVDIARAATMPQIRAFSAVPVWTDDIRAVLLSVKTDRRSRCFVRFTSIAAATIYDVERFTLSHDFLLTSDNLPTDADAEIVCYFPGSADSSIQKITLHHPVETFATGGFNPKPYSAPPAQLTNYIRDFYHDGSPVFVINDISSGDFGDTKTIGFSGGKLAERHVTKEIWIPRGLGDSNGDGITEVLAHSFSDARLFQGKTTSDSPFTDTLFTEKATGFAGRKEFYAAGMFDLDGDGHEEVFGFSDSVCIAYKFSNGKYTILAAAPNNSPRGAIGSPNSMRPPVCHVGDFDGDGRPELLYGDTDGDFLIFEYADGKFTREFLSANEGEGGTEFCTPVDVDGDGKKELLLGFYASPQFSGDREYSPAVWTYKLLKSTASNTYEVIWEDKFYGVRVGTLYANGVSAGNLDGQPGEEIVLLPFPNLYVMRWDKTASTFRPLWFSPFQYSNTALVYDFDGNGIKELGYCDGSRTVFVEYTPDGTGPGVPSGLDGWATGAKTAVLRWSAAPFATEYQLFAMRNPTETTTSAEFIASTTGTEITLDTLTPNTLYRFYLRAKRVGAVQPDGAFTLPVDVFTHEPIRPVAAEWNSNAVFVKFSAGYLPTRPLPEHIFTLKKGATELVPAAIFVAGDSTLILRFDRPVEAGVWQLSARSFTDRFRTPTQAATLDVTVEVTDNRKEMVLSTITVVDRLTLRLRYSEPINSAEAAVIVNYELLPSGLITSIEKSGDSTVIIRLDAGHPLAPVGTAYTLTVRNVTSTSGMPITRGAGNTLGFIIFENDPDAAYCYPNPFRQRNDDELTFAGLPHDAVVTVYSLEMKPLATLHDTHGTGGIRWKPITPDGEALPTGVYLFKTSGTAESGAAVESGLIKFTLIR